MTDSPRARSGGICEIGQENCANETVELKRAANATARGHAAAVSVGATIEPEGGRPLVPVATVETPIPSQLVFSASACGQKQTRRFAFAVRSAVSMSAAEHDYEEALANKQLRAEHVQETAELWQSGVELGDAELARVANSSLYLVMAGLRADFNFSCCPTGLSSSGWAGVAFADCELWHEPPMLMLQPNISKSMRAFRTNGLPQANANARRYASPLLGHLKLKGARFPWEATAHGFEGASTVFSHWVKYELHISADIAFAHMQYYRATGDRRWLRANFPLLRDVAVYHQSRVEKSPDGGYHVLGAMPSWRLEPPGTVLPYENISRAQITFPLGARIAGAMGPDEYNYNIDDPAFTMAVMQITLRFAAEAAAVAGDTTASSQAWLDIAENLRIPQFNATLGATPEYRGYPPAAKRPGRNPDIKQADQLMMTYPLHVNQTQAVVHANALYYSQKCPNGPAMTWPINTIAFLRSDDAANAARYFNISYRKYREVPFGVWSEEGVGRGHSHFVTGPGGFLQSLLNGYGGLQLEQEWLALRMTLPVGVPSLTLRKVHYRGRAFSAELKGDIVTVSPVGDAAGLFATCSDGAARELTSPLVFKENERITLAVQTIAGEDEYTVSFKTDESSLLTNSLPSVYWNALNASDDDFNIRSPFFFYEGICDVADDRLLLGRRSFKSDDLGPRQVSASAPCGTMCGNLTGIPKDGTWQACEPSFIQKNYNKTCGEDCHCPKITLERMIHTTRDHIAPIKTARANDGFFQLAWVNISHGLSRVAYVVYQRWIPTQSRPMNLSTPKSQICGALCGDVESAAHSDGTWLDCQPGWVVETVCATASMVTVPALQPFSHHMKQTCIPLESETGRQAGCMYFYYQNHHAAGLAQRWQQKFTSNACDMEKCSYNVTKPPRACPTATGQTHLKAGDARFILKSAATVAIGAADAGSHGITQGFETGQFSRNTDDGRLYYLATELGRCASNAWDSGATLGLWSADHGSRITSNGIMGPGNYW
jgi:hypothetical protein